MEATIKTKLYQACMDATQLRIDQAQKAMDAAQESRDNETKSSVGDKYETGRAMMQSQQERNKVQMIKAIQLQQQLKKINPQKQCTAIEPGCLIDTDRGHFFIAIGLGKLQMDEQNYFIISMQSPIGQFFLGKQVGEKVSFQKQQYLIKAIQ